MNSWLKAWHRLAAPHHFYAWAKRYEPWLLVLGLCLLITGSWWGLFVAPADYQQGDAVRIIYVHVPAAWMSMFVYASMVVSAVLLLVWQMRMAEIALIASAGLGVGFTLMALVTGAIWGKPMWGTWWVWDARLTSELILAFIYLAIIALYYAFEERRLAGKASALLTLVGAVNLPIIHYSVVWWNTLHQPATVSKLGTPSIHTDMLWPLLVMALAFQLLFAWMLLVRMRALLLQQDAASGWLRAYIDAQKGKTL